MSNPCFHRHPDLRLTALDGEGVVLHLASRKYFSVNDTGVSLLEALRRPCTMDELVAGLVRDYEVTPELAAETTRAFLDRCVAAALVREVACPSA